MMSKIFFLFCIGLLFSGVAKGQVSSDRNFVATNMIKQPNVTTAAAVGTLNLQGKTQEVVYFDGLGRPLQKVQTEVSTGNKDLITPIEYDGFGREVKKFLPYAETGTNTPGALRINSYSAQAAFYSSSYSIDLARDAFPFSQDLYEFSPFNRIREKSAPGTTWQPAVNNARTIKQVTRINTLTDAVRFWNVTNQANSFGSYTTSAVYNANELVKTITEDEHGKQTIEFKDREGKIILKKVQFSANADNGSGSGHTGWYCTYYIYDELNNLRCVVQPRGVELLEPNGWNITALNNDILNEQCFRYEYDIRNRMIVKKVPGAGEVRMVYDRRDRLVLTQDANLRTTNKWLFAKYDVLNRPVATGFYTNTTATSQAAMQTLIDNSYATQGDFEVRNQSQQQAYTLNQCFPTVAIADVLSFNYYDDYEWTSWYGSQYGNKDNSFDYLFASPNNNNYPYPQPLTTSNIVTGLPTGTWTRVLNSSVGLTSVQFYDDKGKVIQTKSNNISNGLDIVTTQYNWSGQPLQTVYRHELIGTNAQTSTLITKLTYDDLGRLIKTEKKTAHSQVNSGAVPANYTVTSQLEYDQLGQLKNKKLAPYFNSNTGLETLTYDYNIRGWMLGVNRSYLTGSTNNNWFSMELMYDKILSTINGNAVWSYEAQFNGNISASIWKTKGDNKPRRYDFQYDNVNRLGNATYRQENGSVWNANEMNFNVGGFDADNGYKIKYDANGNILGMVTSGTKINTPQFFMDALRYTYKPNSNKLDKVSDDYGNTVNNMGDFMDGTNGAAADYDYDANGNLTLDQNKKINAITYNHLNLPQTITVTGKGTITYTYDAAGNKLNKQTQETGVSLTSKGISYTNITITTTTIYIAGFVYETKAYSNSTLQTDLGYTNKLQFTGFEEGRIRALYNITGQPNTINGFAYDYMIKDHLGNVRMVLTDEQQINYYPATTLEGTFSTSNPQANSMVNHEKGFYNINNAYVVNEPWNTTQQNADVTKQYLNHNNIPPASPNPNYPSGVSPTQTAGSTNMYKLNASVNKTGLEFIIKVMSGDKVDILGKSYHTNTTTVSNGNSSALTLLPLLTNLLGAPANAISAKGITATQLQTSAAGIPNTFFRGSNGEGGTSVPKAYINYIFLDEQFKYVGGGFSRVGSSGIVKDHFTADAVQLQNINVPKNGYLLVYVSNESNFDVFFDNLQVVHKPGPLVEETHYYPFGLTMQGISSQALPSNAPNRIKFNGYEQQNKEFSDGSGLEWYDYKHRFYDNQIGRFFVQDRLADEYVYYTPYQFAGNEVPNAIDLDGLEPYYANPKQIFYHAAEKLTFAVGNLIDKVGYKAEAGVTFFKNIFSSGTTSVSSETTAKGSIEFQPTFTAALGKIRASTEPTSDFSLFSINVKGETSTALVTKSDVGVASVKEEVSVNNLGVVQNKSSGEGKFVIAGIPLTFGLSSSNSSNGEKDRSGGVSISPNSNTKLGIQFKETKKVDNTQRAEATIKAEVSTPGKTGVKVFGGFSLFTSY